MPLEKVCEESRRPFTWYYNDSEQMYTRTDPNGNKNGLISGRDIPDPMGIFEARSKAVQQGKLPKESRVHADPVTKTLWEHWQAQA